MDKVFIVDVNKCNGCYDCLMACNDVNLGEILADSDLLHPFLGQYLMKIEEHLYGELPTVKQYFMVKPCMHCRNAPCAQCCPVEAIRINEYGMAELLKDKCINCRLCVYACPYDLIFYDRENGTIAKCSGCSDLLREGKEPACVTACEWNAIRLCDRDEIKGTEELYQIIPETGMKPSVFYRNLPEK